MTERDRKHRRAEAIGQGVADLVKALANLGLFALGYLVFHGMFGIDREWALAAAVVYALSETRRPW